MRAIAKIIGLIVSLPFFLVAISFAISNTEPMTLSLWPFEGEAVLPVALAVFIILIAGFILGAVSAFIGAGKLRRRLRNAEFRLRQMEMEAARAKREEEAAAAQTKAAQAKQAEASAKLNAPSDKPALAAE